MGGVPRVSSPLLPAGLKPSVAMATPTAIRRLLSATAAADVPPEDEAHASASLVVRDEELLRCSPTGLRILDLVDAGAVCPDLAIYSDLVRRCTRSGRLDAARLVHAHFRTSRFTPDAFFGNSIVNMYAKCGGMDDAHRAFDEMPLRDMVSWTALITGYAQNDRPKEAVDLFPGMLQAGLKPNQFTFASLLKASGAVQSDEPGRQIHVFCIKCGCDLNVYVGSSLLDMYARRGDIEAACLVFDSLDSKNEVSWNALIAGFVRKGETETSIKNFREMQRTEFKASHFTYSSILGACSHMGALEQGKWVHACLVKSGCKLTAFVGNTLLDMYAKSGSIDDARKVFDRLHKRDVVSWNSMLTGCAQHGLGKEAICRFEEMLKIGIQPNEITFLSVLTACSHSGLVNEGQHYFDLMMKYEVKPQIEHYVTIVDLLGRAGLLNRAESFIREMPIKPTSAVWGALLGACRMHKNAELGKYAAERVFELDPRDSGPHVLLYNIYASTGRWDDAAEVRKMMKESGMKKEPACSWVEIENSVHMFVANDDTHPQKEAIYKMWENINGKIKELGYVPDTDYVHLFVDKQEREAKLQYHSEKLALAFALLNTPPSATIRIKKNIRVCGDCHSAIKLVSKVMKREIIVRDTNRFHHFSYGFCSCGDYW
uniref:Pentatricopeptide repeat-containing protein At3g24000, mitochondrial n=1 Tax=Anthurium amnicola TaxID=1678845 RepID=A0A1D1YD09_9ARAE